MKDVVLVTGSCGLVGAEACLHFDRQGYRMVGVDNDTRARLFGQAARTKPQRDMLCEELDYYDHHHADICDVNDLDPIFVEYANKIAYSGPRKLDHQLS